MTSVRALVAAGAAALAVLPLAAQQAPQKIPLRAGLTVVTAIASPQGDGESIKRIEGIDAAGIHLSYSGDIDRKRSASPNPLDVFGGQRGRAGRSAGQARERVTSKRTIRREDLKSARDYQALFGPAVPTVIPGSTAISTSSAVLADLKQKGRTDFSCACEMSADAALGRVAQSLESILGSDAPELKDLGDAGMLRGTLARVGTGTVPFAVLVNNQRVNLQAIHARGRLGGKDAAFFFLDDPDHPLTLRWHVAGSWIQVVKIAFPGDQPSRQIETTLEKTGRAEVYGIYFDTASAAMKPESEPVLKEIADALAKNPTWKLNVEGHTDNIGGDAYNLDLSRQRAAAVKDALVTRHRIGAARLATEGFGASRPKETNNTLDGRARNRRVELVRQ